ncbi:peptide-methionine (S)-S-oxide reductase MsrA [Sphingomonas quercus]|uniref:Peptide methionine sulfoxide reductase MsrA n=1 Tax=Sphingomonas quercus TaxID=2842451 RepID=A0ABS6BIJ0_9SPHN|nr:peptide-methionine (S)-S-oxide reductase MsrA [Sphingomonas quercus]MBU3078119.1 peptide-methionine (S)-S-oxide reductase MsrA [Sphingomonas quercus]
MFHAVPAVAADQAVRVPAPALDMPGAARTTETAVFAGGCFWGVQGVFQHVKGVKSAVSGYAGGPVAKANYDAVSGGDTGHAESVQVTYDPRVVSYGRLLQIYFSVVADPTTLNYQGPDHGSQYRTAFFPQSEDQRRVAIAYIAQLERAHIWGRPIVTRIEPARGFYPAEAHHQDYLYRNPRVPYIAINDMPKVEALKRLFPQDWQVKPVLVGA